MSCDLSIVIVSWNTRELLRACLASLPAATGGLDAEILVADNASSDGSCDMIRAEFPAVTVLETGGNLGFAPANNLALARATGQRLLLLNPDTVCPPESLVRLCAALDALPDAVAVGPDLTDEHHRSTACWGDFPAARYHWLSLVDPARRWLPRRWRDAGLGRTAGSARATARHRDVATGALAVDYVKGACLLTRRGAWERVGPLDEHFFLYFEETDWCRRASVDGHRVYLCPDVAVQHLEGQATGQVSDFSLRQFQHSYRLYMAKHHGPTAVKRIRRAQWWEYRWKALLHRLVSQPESAGLKARYARIAELQRLDDVEPPRPA